MILVYALLGFILGNTGSVCYARELPPPPQQFVYDELSLLSQPAVSEVSKILDEHQKLTTEQVVVAFLKNPDQEDVAEFASRLFKYWEIGQTKKNNGILVLLFVHSERDRAIRIEVGYGLEPIMTDAKSKRIIENQFIPLLKEGRYDDAIKQGTAEILRTLESPLFSGTDQATRSLLESGSYANTPRQSGSGRLYLILFFWLLIILIFINSRLRNELHYSSSGRSYRAGGLGGFGGFGGFGGSGGGGFGGFSGGGGISGGGGASGRW